jgi:hypothetical protein
VAREQVKTMKPLSVMRFVIYGTVGFGIGWAVLGVLGGGFPMAGGVGTVIFGAIFSGDLPSLLLYAPILSLGGAIGGAALGLAIEDFRRVVIQAVLGALGFLLGSFIVVALFFLLSFMQLARNILEGAASGVAAQGIIAGIGLLL